jgi:hypothetical protein
MPTDPNLREFLEDHRPKFMGYMGRPLDPNWRDIFEWPQIPSKGPSEYPQIHIQENSITAQRQIYSAFVNAHKPNLNGYFVNSHMLKCTGYL